MESPGRARSARPSSSTGSPQSTLFGLLLSDRRRDWSAVRDHVLSHPSSAAAPYYRDETPLQLALRARDGRKTDGSGESDDIPAGEKPEEVTRIDALEALACADPPSVLSRRDAEGRTALHTAASSGRSADVLRWLVGAEAGLAAEACTTDNSEEDCEEDQSRREPSAALRTDHPGGALPLHLAAACPSFDPSPGDCCGLSCGEAALVSSLVICPVTPAVLAAYASTEVVREANPGAVWEVDCDGETPVHSSAWGGVGSLVSLLLGAAGDSSSSEEDRSANLRRAASARDVRGKTPLDRACERLRCLCVHAGPRCGGPRGRSDGSLGGCAATRGRDPFGPGPAVDPFAPPGDGAGRRADFARAGSGRRIPGCGSGFLGPSRSLSSSFVGGTGGLELEDGDEVSDTMADSHDRASRLREPFVMRRRAVHPRFGLEGLDDDGLEELSKAVLLLRASYGRLGPGGAPFRAVHAAVASGCPPEVVWHAAATFPRQVGERDEFGRTPLCVACERLALLHAERGAAERLMEALSSAAADGHEDTEVGEAANALGLVGKGEEEEEDVDEEDYDDDPRSRAARRLVESILFGDDAVSVQDLLLASATAKRTAGAGGVPNDHDGEGGNDDDMRTSDCDDLARRRAEGAEAAEKDAAARFRSDADALHEVIGMLVHSESFGRPGAVSAPDADGRLPLHHLLGSGVQFADGNDPDPDAMRRVSGRTRTESAVMTSVADPLRLLIGAYPASLEVRDGGTGLLPFMLAAASYPALREQSGDYDDDAGHLETVYRLLRAAPNAI